LKESTGKSYILGSKLKWARKKKNFTQERLADLIGVHRITISRWEAHQGRPSLVQTLRLKEILDLTLDDLSKVHWITDPDLSQIPIPQLQQKTQKALQAFPFSKLVERAPQLGQSRLQALLCGQVPAPIEIQYLRDCLGRDFLPLRPAQTRQQPVPLELCEQEALFARLTRLENLVDQLIHRQVG